jgi:CRISPR-associated protein Cmr2
MDLAAGLSRCLEGGAGGTAFLAFKLSPVQTFIRAARSTRDLLSGSQILAWITFRAILAVAGDLGPTALIYPALRGLPWMDLWLRESCGLAGKVGRPADLELVTPCLPNRFLAVVPVAEAPAIAESVREAARSAWLELAAAVRSWLDQRWAASYPDWARLWDAQVASFFDVRTTVLRESECSGQ